MAIRLLATGDTTPLGLVRWETPSSQSQGNGFAATLGWGTLPRWGKRDAGEFGIPTGFHPSAQGCGLPATLGTRPQTTANPNGVVSLAGRSAHEYGTPFGLMESLIMRLTQDCGLAARLGNVSANHDNFNGIVSFTGRHADGDAEPGVNPKRNVRPIPDCVCAGALCIRPEKIVFGDAVADWQCNWWFCPRQKD